MSPTHFVYHCETLEADAERNILKKVLREASMTRTPISILFDNHQAYGHSRYAKDAENLLWELPKSASSRCMNTPDIATLLAFQFVKGAKQQMLSSKQSRIETIG
jgi:hypothetical protein